jgi:2-methylcitrate dehydratase PrpD
MIAFSSAADYLTRLARLAGRVRIDEIGLAGSRLPENARLADLAAERSGLRTATIVGHARKAEPMLATLANGTAGVSLEVDEGNRWGGGHPAIHVLPAALAVAEELGADGGRLIEALVAGYEITSRLGGATHTRPNLHSHGTWGTAGAAVAVARLLGHETDALRTVINLATSMSPANSWAPCFEGATIRNLYPGRAGLQGILAVHLLACGYTAVADAPADVYGTLLAEGFDPEAAVEGLGDDGSASSLRIERNYFKFHACCLYNHPALDAVHTLARECGVAAEAVDHVTVTSIPFVTRMTEREPATMLAAKFSLPYAVATALVTGATDVSAFFDGPRRDPRIRDLAARVEVRSDPAMSMRSPAGPTARVVVTLRDGRVLTQDTTVVHGDAANPRSREELVAKFMGLTAETLDRAQARAVVELVDQLERVKDVRDLTTLLTGQR